MKHFALLFSFTLALCASAFADSCLTVLRLVGNSYVHYDYRSYDTYSAIGGGIQCAISGLNSYETLPLASVINGLPLTRISNNAFICQTFLREISLPPGVTTIGTNAFYGCEGMISIKLPVALQDIRTSAFSYCSALQDITIPICVTNIGGSVFFQCSSLTNITFNCNLPHFEADAFLGVPKSTVITIGEDAEGWDTYQKAGLTPPWGSRKLVFLGTQGNQDDIEQASSSSENHVFLTVSNVIVHYIQTVTTSPMSAPISSDVGLVNIITEVKGGGMVIPETWTNNYPFFVQKFGANLSKALTKLSGKRDAAGNVMTVWQDYVAGTDPTDETDVFRASVTLVDGLPVISFTPELSDEEKALRKYTTWGKVKLQDSEWVEIPAGQENLYNFFKVSVEMK